MASAQPTTMVEALQRVISDVSAAMVTPDADIPFLTQLQGVVVGRMRQGSGQPQGQPQQGGGQPGGQPGQPPQPQQQPPGGGPGGQPSPAGPPSGPPGGAPGPQLQGRPTPNGVTPLAQAPDPDELRRMLAGKAGA